MHEWAIGKNLAEAVLLELGRLSPRSKLQAVSVVIGDLRQIVPEYLEFAYQASVEGTPAAGAKLHLRHQPVMLHCGCGWQGEVKAPPLWCAACGSRAVDLVQGMELALEALEIEEEDDSKH